MLYIGIEYKRPRPSGRVTNGCSISYSILSYYILLLFLRNLFWNDSQTGNERGNVCVWGWETERLQGEESLKDILCDKRSISKGGRQKKRKKQTEAKIKSVVTTH